MWPAFAFNLVAAMVIAGWFARAVRRLERRMDERERAFETWADGEEKKYELAREEVRASRRAKSDRAIAESVAMSDPSPAATALNGWEQSAATASAATVAVVNPGRDE